MEDMILVPRSVFQNLHSAARSAYQSFCRMDVHTPESAAAMEILNQAIDMGHDLLGTNRGYADRYIASIGGGITQLQADHIREIFKREGLVIVDKSPQEEA